MGIGILFFYLLIAAVLAPVVWLMWWGATSVADPARIRTAPAPAPAPKTSRSASRFSFPQPVDLTLPRYAKTVAICRVKDGVEVDGCSGPDHAGKCPRALADGTVSCAGSVLSLPRPIRGSMEWQIPPGYRACLLGSYEVFRQPATGTPTAAVR